MDLTNDGDEEIIAAPPAASVLARPSRQPTSSTSRVQRNHNESSLGRTLQKGKRTIVRIKFSYTYVVCAQLIDQAEKAARSVAGPSSGVPAVPPNGAPQMRVTSELIEISDDEEEEGHPALDVNYHPNVSSCAARNTQSSCGHYSGTHGPSLTANPVSYVTSMRSWLNPTANL